MDTPSRAWSELLDWSFVSAGDSIKRGAQLQGEMVDWWLGALGLDGVVREQNLKSALTRRMRSAGTASDEYLRRFDLGSLDSQSEVEPQGATKPMSR